MDEREREECENTTPAEWVQIAYRMVKPVGGTRAQAAASTIVYADQAGLSPEGMAELVEILRREGLLLGGEP